MQFALDHHRYQKTKETEADKRAEGEEHLFAALHHLWGKRQRCVWVICLFVLHVKRPLQVSTFLGRQPLYSRPKTLTATGVCKFLTCYWNDVKKNKSKKYKETKICSKKIKVWCAADFTTQNHKKFCMIKNYDDDKFIFFSATTTAGSAAAADVGSFFQPMSMIRTHSFLFVTANDGAKRLLSFGQGDWSGG